MAEEELAPEGEALEPELETPQDDTPEPIAKLASDLGWTPKDQWQGDPEKWKPAEQFIRDGREIQHTTARELRSVREQMERLGGVTETIIQDRVATARANWEREFDQAVEDGDTARARELRAKEPTAPAKATGPDPTVQRWVADNPWFETHPRAKAVAAEISDKLARQGFDVPTQLKEAEAEVKLRYPDLFKAPTKAPPATQTGQSRNPNPSNRVKGFTDMPQDSQRIALDFEKRLGVPKEQTAKSYWAEQEGVKR